MNLIWHMAMKDARRMWPPVVLWLLLLTGLHYTDWAVTHAAPDDAFWLMRAKFFHYLFLVTHVLTVYVLTAALAVEDPPFGSTTFWLTRPVSGAHLLVAKVVACVLLFLVLPVLVSLPWFVAGSTDASGWLAAIGGLLHGQVWVVVPALVIAAFTGTLGKFLAATVGVILTGVVALLLCDLSGIRTGARFFIPLEKDSFVACTAAAIVLVGSGAAMVMQYQTRKKPLALMVAIVGVVGAVLSVFVTSA